MRVILAVCLAIAALGTAVMSGAAATDVQTTGNPLFRATLRGDGHVANVGTPWHFVVRAVDLHNRPVPGTAIVRVRQKGKIVDTIGWFGFRKGVVRRTYHWAPILRGSYVLLEAKVIGPGGTRLLGYAVKVR
jgi:hypothetical protein